MNTVNTGRLLCRRGRTVDNARLFTTVPSLRVPQTDTRPSRRAITLTSDDGRYSWNQLSTGEKVIRSTQQSFNMVLVSAGAIGSVSRVTLKECKSLPQQVLVAYFLYQELFAADSKTRQFNHAVDRVRADTRCRELLGPPNEIRAYGEPTTSKWARARPLAHTVEVDKLGTTHFRMHFHVEGPDAAGIVNIHMTRKADEDALSYKLLSLSVPGHQTIYLENADSSNPKKAISKMFGVQWK